MTPAQEFAAACRIAQAHGMFAIARDGDHVLYRKTAGRAVRLGKRRDPAEFRRFVQRAAQSK